MTEKEIIALLGKATKLETNKDFDGALKLINEAKREAEKHFGKHHRVYVSCLHHQAVCFYNKGSLVSARDKALRGLEILNSICSSEELHHDLVWQTLVNLVTIC